LTGPSTRRDRAVALLVRPDGGDDRGAEELERPHDLVVVQVAQLHHAHQAVAADRPVAADVVGDPGHVAEAERPRVDVLLDRRLVVGGRAALGGEVRGRRSDAAGGIACVMVAVGWYTSTCGRDWTCDLRASIELGSVDIFIDKLETASDASPSYAATYADACVW
jgi:hypothetical protein